MVGAAGLDVAELQCRGPLGAHGRPGGAPVDGADHGAAAARGPHHPTAHGRETAQPRGVRRGLEELPRGRGPRGSGRRWREPDQRAGAGSGRGPRRRARRVTALSWSAPLHRPSRLAPGGRRGQTAPMDWTLEVVLLPVSDLERAISFYRDQVGFNLDHHTVNEHMDVAQLTPHGSGCSIVVGNLPSQRDAPLTRAPPPPAPPPPPRGGWGGAGWGAARSPSSTGAAAAPSSGSARTAPPGGAAAPPPPPPPPPRPGPVGGAGVGAQGGGWVCLGVLVGFSPPFPPTSASTPVARSPTSSPSTRTPASWSPPRPRPPRATRPTGSWPACTRCSAARAPAPTSPPVSHGTTVATNQLLEGKVERARLRHHRGLRVHARDRPAGGAGRLRQLLLLGQAAADRPRRPTSRRSAAGSTSPGRGPPVRRGRRRRGGPLVPGPRHRHDRRLLPALLRQPRARAADARGPRGASTPRRSSRSRPRCCASTASTSAR